MANPFLKDSLAKIDRGQTQIEELNAEIGRFIDIRPYEIVSKYDPGRDEQVWSFRVTKNIPRVIPVIVGEVLHNLRSALDQMVCAIALQHSGKTKDTYFPFGTSASHFEAQLTEKGKQLPSDARDMIRAVKPYPGGNDLLVAMHHLNRADKHINVAPVNLRTTTNTGNYLVMKRGVMLVIGSRRAQRHIELAKPRPTVAEIAAMEQTGTPTGIYNLLMSGITVFGTDGCTPEESFEFLTTTPNSEFETDVKPTIDIAFQDIQGFELEPIVAVLFQMRECTQRICLPFLGRLF
jgi:hypothetical protein